MKIQNIEIEIVKKKIKNLHLSVLPPSGTVRISAPLSVSDENIRLFAASKISWIRAQQNKFATQLRHSEREYVSGETIYIWGKQYFMQVEYSYKSNNFLLDGEKVILTVRKESTAKQRRNYVNEVLRQYMKDEINQLLPVLEQKTGLKCKRWLVKYMKTRWGTYSDVTGTISLNLQLVHKPIECLEYIIVHELGHTIYRSHGKDFIAYVDTYLPYWREIKNKLNTLTLDYIEE
ncbi:MAG: M48 family metallopeptidase [Cytophagaceae bacterium]|jgi:predicted metal-dependent hydrolase|nr:M48 family metallopeptidase [Cytophagaceae bacterium]